MKLVFAFLFVLMLAGCAAEVPPEVTEETTVAVTEPEELGIYVPDHTVELQSNGAVRAYLPDNEVAWVYSAADRLLVAHTDGSLSVFSGDCCVPRASAKLSMEIPLDSFCWAPINGGVAYYSKEDGKVIFLDTKFQQFSEVELPAQMEGLPLIAPKTGWIYYCAGDEVRAVDPVSGISHLIKKHTFTDLKLLENCFDGTALLCSIGNGQGQQETVFLSAQTGETMDTVEALLSFDSYGDSYFATQMDGIVLRYIYGSRQSTTQCVEIPDEAGTPVTVLSLNGAVTVVQDLEYVELSFYDLLTGKRRACVTLSDLSDVNSLCADDKFIWFIANQKSSGEQMIFRWDIEKSIIEEELSYLYPFYTADAPDNAGLSQCQNRVNSINKKYGVEISIWKNAVKKPGEYILSPEYQVAAIEYCLNELEAAFALFPDNFLKTTGKSSASNKIHIAIVRSTSGGESLQYWQSGNAYIVLTPDSDIQKEFLRNVAYVVDTHILGNSVKLDDWNALNPDGFSYDYDYAINAERKDTKYLDGSKRAFVDRLSMSFPTEDRARIFVAALSEDGKEIFTSETMQNKLRQLCVGIRYAYGLRKSTETFLWEQYLNESLAYVKK